MFIWILCAFSRILGLSCYRHTLGSFLKAATTATATKTSPENITLFHYCLFSIISTRSTSTEMVNYPGTTFVGVAFKLPNKMKNSPSCVHVLHKTALNEVISRCCFAEDGKEMYQNVRRTCRAPDCFSSLNLLFYCVAVAVTVVIF